MKIIKSIFELYLITSIHVSFAVWALFRISVLYLDFDNNPYLDYLVVTSSIVGYNKIKYGSVFFKNRKLISNEIIFTTILAFIIGLWSFAHVSLLTQFIFIITFLIVVFYTIPPIPLKNNLRNTYGIKIFLVSFSWTMITHFSLINEVNSSHYFQYLILAIQRFIFVFVAIIPFEIRDIRIDESRIGTLPQRFGIFKSKLLGILLLTVNIFILFLVNNMIYFYKYLELSIYIFLAYSLIFSDKKKSLNFTRFWVEGIPIFWYINLFFFNQLLH
tara:strand:+ start:12235 stop:13053 length:819 start_codon:yes stop_codon:yes gene_type:complete